MAYIFREWCSACGADKEHINYKCVTCAVLEAKKDKAIWNCLTNEEKIEELLQRIKKLEAGRRGYA